MPFLTIEQWAELKLGLEYHGFYSRNGFCAFSHSDNAIQGETRNHGQQLVRLSARNKHTPDQAAAVCLTLQLSLE